MFKLTLAIFLISVTIAESEVERRPAPVNNVVKLGVSEEDQITYIR